MSGGGGSSKSTTVNYSPAEAKRRTQIMDEALRIYGEQAGQIGQFPGAVPVGFSEDTLQAQNMLRDTAMQGQQSVAQLNDAVKFGLSGALDVNNNPYLQQSIDAALRPISARYTDPGGVLSQIRGEAVQTGGYGGSRQGIAEGVAAGRYLDEVGDTTAQMMSDAYGKGLDTFSRTMAFAPQAMQAAALPSQQLSAVGVQNEQLAQDFENYLAAAREWDINAPWAPLQNAANIVYGGGSSQSTSKTQGPAKNPLMGAIGGGMAGWAAGASMGSSFGPWGAAAGALIGALM